jgi:Ferritin-like
MNAASLADPVAPGSISTIEELRTHLQWAIELEHATLPPYLCALYSLDPVRNPDAVAVISGVFVEEMLHLALAANILNAVGGRPRLDSPALLTPHPRPMPHGDRSLELSLVPFGPEALEMFLRIERPAPPTAAAEPDGYETIKQFYAAVEEGLRRVCAHRGERAVFCGDPARQVRAAHFRHSAGKLVVVDSLATALAALEEIVEQGEGSGPDDVWDGDADLFHPGQGEVAHYYRFQELQLGRRYRAGDTPRSGPTGEAISVDPAGVRPMRPNPRPADHPLDHPIRAAQEEFNRTYCSLLAELEQAFDGHPEMLGAATGTMFALKAQAGALMQMPDGPGRTAGPSFDYVPPELRTRPVAEPVPDGTGHRIAADDESAPLPDGRR